MSIKDGIYGETPIYAFLKSFFVPSLHPAFMKTVPSIFFNFFFRQFRAAILPGRVPVSSADHPLDEKIPFVPAWVTIYLDFVFLWIRTLSFFLRRYKRAAYIPIREFIYSMGRLYAFAAEVYKKNFSTTKRPFYIARPRFFLIHLVDPHLMCVPSLHIMVVIHTYTMFAAIAKTLGEGDKLKMQLAEVKQGALAISRAVLFVKQHSVNCIPAALYAMTCFTPDLFPPEEAEAFARMLFDQVPPVGKTPHNCRVHPSAAPVTILPDADKSRIIDHILSLYRRFLIERESVKSWEEPLINFLRALPKA